jgi:hypothetical protein
MFALILAVAFSSSYPPVLLPTSTSHRLLFRVARPPLETWCNCGPNAPRFLNVTVTYPLPDSVTRTTLCIIPTGQTTGKCDWSPNWPTVPNEITETIKVPAGKCLDETMSGVEVTTSAPASDTCSVSQGCTEQTFGRTGFDFFEVFNLCGNE